MRFWAKTKYASKAPPQYVSLVSVELFLNLNPKCAISIYVILIIDRRKKILDDAKIDQRNGWKVITNHSTYLNLLSPLDKVFQAREQNSQRPFGLDWREEESIQALF